MFAATNRIGDFAERREVGRERELELVALEVELPVGAKG